MKKIVDETKPDDTQEAKAVLSNREMARVSWQVWSDLERAKGRLFDLRHRAQSDRRLDEEQELTEAIHALSRCEAWYRGYVSSRFNKTPEKLEVYK